MKFSCLIPALLIGGAALAQNNEYAITSYAEDGFLAPNTHYLGEAWLDDGTLSSSLTFHVLP